MDFTKPRNDVTEIDDDSDSGSRGGCFGWIVKSFIFLIVCVLLLVLAAPWALSLAPVRAFALAQVNARLAPRTLAVDSWSLGWFSGQSVEGIRFTDPEQGLVAAIGSLTADRGLLKLIPRGAFNFGAIQASNASVALNPPPKTSPIPAPDSSPAPETKQPFKLPFDDISGSFKLENATVSIGGEKVLEQITVSGAIESMNKPFEVTAQAALPQTAPHAAIAFTAKMAPVAELMAPDVKAPGTLSLVLSKMPLAPFSRAAAAFAGSETPAFDGIVNLNGSVELQTLLSGRVKAALACDNFSLAVPGQKPSAPAAFMLNADLAFTPDRLVKLAAFEAVSPWLKANASGTINLADAKAPAFHSVVAAADLDAAAVLRDFGDWIPRDPKLAVKSGHLTFDAKIDGAEGIIGFDVKARAEKLDMAYAGSPLTFTPQPSLTLQGQFDSATPLASEINAFTLATPAGSFNGKGSMKGAALAGNLDLAKLVETLNPLLPPGTLPDLNGTFSLQGQLTPASDHLSFSFVTDMKDLKLTRPGEAPFAIPAFELMMTSRLPMTADGKPQVVLQEGQAALRVPNTLSMTGGWKSIDPVEKQFDALSVKSEAQLEPLLALVKPFLPEGSAANIETCKGTFILNFTAASKADKTLALSLNTALQGAALSTSSWHIREAELFKGSGQMTLPLAPAGTVRIAKLDLTSPAGTLSASGSLPLGENLLKQAVLDLSGTAQTVYLTDRWRIHKPDSKDAVVEGLLTFSAKINPGQIDAAAQSKNLSVAVPGEKPLAVPFEARVKAKPAFKGEAIDSIAFQQLSLASPFIAAEVAGALTDFDASKTLALKGTLTPDFDAISKLPQVAALNDFALSGRNTTPFTFEGPLGSGVEELLALGRATGQVKVDSIRLPGIVTETATCTLALRDGVLAIDGRTGFNGGSFNVAPRVSLTTSPWVVTFPEGMKLLTDAALTQDLLNACLAGVNPILQGAVTPEGTLDWTIESFSLPLSKNPLEELNANMNLTFKGFAFTPSGILSQVLEAVKSKVRRVAPGDGDLSIEIVDGNLTSAPLKFKVGDSIFTCLGTTHLASGTIAYNLSVPLDEKLLGSKIAKFTDGRIIQLPIGGSVTKPRADIAQFQKSVGNLAVDVLESKGSELLNKEINKGLNRLFEKLDR